MMLLLGRLITLPLLLLRPRVKISFSLLRPWRFLIPILTRRFVMGVMHRVQRSRAMRAWTDMQLWARLKVRRRLSVVVC
ncbi:hypothetical protein AB9K21_00865 [Anaplasma phagocytophilum]